MQDTQGKLARTYCVACGKLVPRRDIRDRKPAFCDQKCSRVARFQTRYRGTMAGPYDQPLDIMSKTKWQGSDTSDIPTGA